MFRSNLGDDDAFVVRYDSDGNQLWGRQFGTSEEDNVWAISMDGNGGVLLAGSTLGNFGGGTGGEDAFLARYSSTGIQLWVHQFGTPNDDRNVARALVPAGPDGVIVGGSTGGDMAGPSIGINDVFVTRFNIDGPPPPPEDDHVNVGSRFGWIGATRMPLVASTGFDTASGVIENVDDSDLFSFRAPEVGGGTVTLRIDGSEALDGVLTLYNALKFKIGTANLNGSGTSEELVAPEPPADPDAYRDYLGINVTAGPSQAVTFSAVDAGRPFLTANDSMWDTFEPELRRRLSELEGDATTADRVQAVLLELLPAGQSTMDAVAGQLAMSSRTLHRRLHAEDTTFQAILNATREALARHYLANPNLSAGEISFLLGYEEPSSFYRAFHHWTGQTPERVRAGVA